MALNPSIILAGQVPDIMGSIARGQAAGAQANKISDQNALRSLYAERGAGIAAGEENALRALAGLNPAASLGIQGARQGLEKGQLSMDATRQSMSHADANQARLTRAEARQVQAHAAKLSAQERAAQAVEIEQGVARAMGARTPEEFDAIVAEVDPSLVGQFGNRDAIAGRFLSIAEMIKRADAQEQPEKPADEYGRYAFEERKAGREPLSRIEYKRAGMKTTNIRTTPEGGVEIVEGFGSGSPAPKLTVDAAKNTGFLVRTREANRVLNELEGQGTNFGQQALGAVPLGLGNYGRTPEFQKFDQARRDFVNAILRRESGAVISDQEFDNADKQYFPVPGDGPEVIEQKRQNRINAIRGLEVGAGEGLGMLDAQQPVEPVELNTPDFSQMSDEELQRYIESGGN